MKNQMVFYICVWLNTKYMRFLNVAVFLTLYFCMCYMLGGS